MNAACLQTSRVAASPVCDRPTDRRQNLGFQSWHRVSPKLQFRLRLGSGLPEALSLPPSSKVSEANERGGTSPWRYFKRQHKGHGFSFGYSLHLHSLKKIFQLKFFSAVEAQRKRFLHLHCLPRDSAHWPLHLTQLRSFVFGTKTNDPPKEQSDCGSLICLIVARCI